jgi:peptidoglycan/LPS O-acetylase OafA/YrhL
MRVTDFGLLGVMLFFVHTTLVLMFSIERQWDRSNAPHSAPSAGRLFLPFMVRRFFRIYPLSILVVGLVWAFHIPSDLQFGGFDLMHQGSANLVANLLLIQNIARQRANPGPLWSLPLEFQMYLVLPALFVFGTRAKAWWAPIAFWCLTVAAWFGLGFASGMLPLSEGAIRSPAEAVLKFTRFAPCFLPGVVAYKLWDQPRKLPSFLWPVFLLACCGFFVLFSGSEPIEAGWLLCLGVGMAVCFFDEPGDGCAARCSQIVARYSYGIYLLHYFAIWLGYEFFKRLNIVFQTTVFLAVLSTLPFLLYRMVEAPLIDLGVRLSSRLMPLRTTRMSPESSANQAVQPLVLKGGLQ